MGASNFDPNTFYRITNAALGNRVSMDVQNPPGGPTGALMIATTGAFTGQMWQLLATPETSENSFFLSCQFLGALKKLEFQSGNDLTVPFLKPFNTTSDQTWVVSALEGSSYSLAPNVLNGTMVLTATNETKQPFLAGPGGNRQAQEWIITPVRSINNAAFSLSALFPSATNPATIPSATPIPPNSSTNPQSTSGTTVPAASATNSHYTLHNASLAAIILAPISLVAVLGILSIFFCSWRRRSKQRRRSLIFSDRKLSSTSSHHHLRIDPFSSTTYERPSLGPHSPNGIISPYGHSPNHSFGSEEHTLRRDATYRISIPQGLNVPPYQQSPIARTARTNQADPMLYTSAEYDPISPIEQGSPVELPGLSIAPVPPRKDQTTQQASLALSMSRPLPLPRAITPPPPIPTIVIQRSGSLISKWNV